MKDNREELARKIAEKGNEKYGHKTAWTKGMEGFNHDVISTGILTLDYQLGIGGWRLGASVEVFGPPSIGKTSLFGYHALKSAQDAGLLTAIIAVEPEFDESWGNHLGLDSRYNVLFRPDTLEDAFDILRDLVFDGTVQYILFDSLAAGSTEGEQDEKGKKKVGGSSGLISWAIPRIIPKAYKNEVGIMFINQIRDKMDSPYAGVYDSPGGHAQKHAALMRVQVKPGKGRYFATIDGDKIMIGRELVASIIKGKAHGAMGKTAKFDWYWHDVEGFPFGIDQAADVINVGKLTKVIEGSGWLKHPLFPDGKLNGKPAVASWLSENPEAIPKIRDEVLTVMRDRQVARADKPELKVVGNG